MKVKKYTVSNMAEGFALIKSELGEDAIILSSDKTEDNQIILTVAIDEDEEFNFSSEDELETLSTEQFFSENDLRESLAYHNVLEVVREKILATCRLFSAAKADSVKKEVLTQALAKLYAFDDILSKKNPVKIFMGIAGSGKSTAIAKIATQAKFQKQSCAIISTDNVRAGANKQLEAFAQILDVDFAFCSKQKDLEQKIKEYQKRYDFVLIDTPGINPFIDAEVEKVWSLINQINCQKILTLDAGRNVEEAVEIAEIFSDLGAGSLLPTRLDLTRRIGTVLSVAACCDMRFYAASVSSSIAHGVAEITPQSLSKLILSEA